MLSNLLKFRSLSIPGAREPSHPILKTSIPGPQSISYLNQYARTNANTATIKLFTDYSKCVGNYLADADENLILDLSCQDGTLPVGYNHPEMAAYAASKKTRLDLLQRTACGVMPSSHWEEQLKSVLLPLSPKGLSDIFNSCGCSYSSVENAIKLASLWFYKQRFGNKYTDEQLKSALQGKAPGMPNFSLLKFAGAFHGNYMGGLAASGLRSDYPVLDWPTAPFPQSAQEDSRCLEEVRKIFKTHTSPIMAVILEPVQQLGTYFASKEFYVEVEKIARENGAAIIVDESFSGLGGSGKMWAFEHFGINPDIVVFGGKCQASGIFMKPEFRPLQAWQILSTWCGDPVRVEMLRGVRAIVEKHGLIRNAQRTGEYLVNEIGKVVEKGKIKEVRGKGLLIAFDMDNKQKAWKLSNELLQRGVHVNVVKDSVIQLSPSLIFEKKHADVFLEALEKSI